MDQHYFRRRLLKTSLAVVGGTALTGHVRGRSVAQPANTFTIETFKGGPLVEYEFTVRGAVTKTETTSGGSDSITEQNGKTRVSGVVGNGFTDDYRVAAKPTDWSATVSADNYRLLFNGSEFEPGQQQNQNQDQNQDQNQNQSRNTNSHWICGSNVTVQVGDVQEMAISLNFLDLKTGFAGGEFLLPYPDIVTPVSVSLNQEFGQTDSTISGQEVRITVADTEDAFQGEINLIQLGDVRLRGERPAGTRGASEDSKWIYPETIQADDDNGQPLDIRGNCNFGVIFVEPRQSGDCPTVSGTQTTDPDDDDHCEDINGNGRRDFDDVNRFFDGVVNDSVPDDPALDFNDDGTVDAVDVQKLFAEQQEVQ